LNRDKDVTIWKWNKSGKFPVKSVYEHLTRNNVGLPFNRVWRAKIPEKIKVVMWLVEQKAILTKDSMLKRNWQGILAATFVANLKLLATFYSLVRLTELFGELLQFVSIKRVDLLCQGCPALG
jgi:hypothetical protein